MSGFTTARDLSSGSTADVDLRNAINEGLIPGPRMRIATEGIKGSTAVVGDLIEQLRSTIVPMAAEPEPTLYDKLDARVFFQGRSPALHDYSFKVGDAADNLSRVTAKAVAFACGHPNQIFYERYSFDPTRCRFPLNQLQTNAHWLMLASRISRRPTVRYVDIARFLFGHGARAAGPRLRKPGQA
jgi:hypothetical protein